MPPRHTPALAPILPQNQLGANDTISARVQQPAGRRLRR